MYKTKLHKEFVEETHRPALSRYGKHYTHKYVKWLEDKVDNLEKLTQQKDKN